MRKGDVKMMKGYLGLFAILVALSVLPLASGLSIAVVELTDCKLDSSTYACGATATASCQVDLTTTYGDPGDMTIVEVRMVINGKQKAASLTSGNTTSGVWSAGITVDSGFGGEIITFSSVTSIASDGFTCAGSQDTTATGCYIDYTSPKVAANTCECTYSESEGAAQTDNTIVVTRTPSLGCADQSEITYTKFNDYCDPDWIPQLTSCQATFEGNDPLAGIMTKSYYAGDPNCCSATGDNVWFNHNTGSDCTEPLDHALEVTCRLDHWLGYGDEASGSNREQFRTDFDPDDYTKFIASINSPWQPLVGDIDGDGVNEIIVFTTTGYSIYSPPSYASEGSKTVGGTITGQPALYGWYDPGEGFITTNKVNRSIVITRDEPLIVVPTDAPSVESYDYTTLEQSTTPGGDPTGVMCDEANCFFASTDELGHKWNPETDAESTIVINVEAVAGVGFTYVPNADIQVFTGIGSTPALTTGVCTGIWYSSTNFDGTCRNADESALISEDPLADVVLFPMIWDWGTYDKGYVTTVQDGFTGSDADYGEFFEFSVSDDVFNGATQNSFNLIGSLAVDETGRWAYMAVEETFDTDNLVMAYYQIDLANVGPPTLYEKLILPQRTVWENERSTSSEGISNAAIADDYVVINHNIIKESSSTFQAVGAPSGTTIMADMSACPNSFGTGVIDGWAVKGNDMLAASSRVMDYANYARSTYCVYDIEEGAASFGTPIFTTGTSGQGPFYQYHEYADDLEHFFFIARNGLSGASSLSSIDVRNKLAITGGSGLTLPPVVAYHSWGSIQFVPPKYLYICNIHSARNLYWFDIADIDNSSTWSYNNEGGDCEGPMAYNEDSDILLVQGGGGIEIWSDVSTLNPTLESTIGGGGANLMEGGSHIDITNTDGGNYAIIGGGKLLTYTDPANPTISNLGCGGGTILTMVNPFKGYTLQSGNFTHCDMTNPLNPVTIPIGDSDLPSGSILQGADTHYASAVNRFYVCSHQGGCKYYDLDDFPAMSSISQSSITTKFNSDYSSPGAPLIAGRVVTSFKNKTYITVADWDGDYTEDVLTEFGVFKFGVGSFERFESGGEIERAWTIPVDLNSDSLLDMITTIPGSPLINIYETNPKIEALGEGELAIRALRCTTIGNNTGSINIQTAIAAPNPNWVTIGINPGETGISTFFPDISGTGVYTYTYSQTGVYDVTVTVTDQLNTSNSVSDTCQIEVEISQEEAAACNLGEDGEFNYYGYVGDRNWDILRRNTDLIAKSGELKTRGSDEIEYKLLSCSFSSMSVEAKVVPMGVGLLKVSSDGRSGPILEQPGLIVVGEGASNPSAVGVQSGVKRTLNILFNKHEDKIEDWNGAPITDSLTDACSNIVDAGDLECIIKIEIDPTTSSAKLYVDGILYHEEQKTFPTLDALGISGAGDWDYVRLTTSGQYIPRRYQGVVSGLPGQPSYLLNCDDELHEESDVGVRRSYSNLALYCGSIKTGQTPGFCGADLVRQVVAKYPKCAKEAFNYCVDVTYPTENQITREEGVLQGATVCSTIINAGAAWGGVVEPGSRALWNMLTGNLTTALVILLVLVIFIPLIAKAGKK